MIICFDKRLKKKDFTKTKLNKTIILNNQTTQCWIKKLKKNKFFFKKKQKILVNPSKLGNPAAMSTGLG
jgi:hypothetical protein